MHNGHYVAYARTTAVAWYLFDDTDVKQARQVRGSYSVLLVFCKGARAKKDLAFGKLLAQCRSLRFLAPKCAVEQTGLRKAFCS